MTGKVKIDIDEAQRLLAGIPNGLPMVLSRSLNRALSEGRTAAIRGVTDEYTIKARDVRATFATQRATRSKLQASLTSRGGNEPLSKYAYRPRVDTTGARRKSVRVGVRRGALHSLDRVFIKKDGSNIWILERLGRKSYPIEVKYGPAVPLTVGNEAIVDEVIETMQASVEKRLAHETERLLKG